MAGLDAISPTNQVPTANSAPQQGGGMDLISSMLRQNQAIDQEITNTLPSAMTPVKTSGVSSPTLPGAFKFNPQSMPQQAAQGHADAVHKGVAKTVAGVTNLVGGFVQSKKEEKTRVLAADIEKVMGAQDGISKAQEILKNDPSNKEASEAVKKNTQIINDLAAEPKRLKQLEKAFSIDHVNPENNQHLEGDALKMATKSFAERLSAQTPDKMVPNQLAIAKVSALQAQKKENLDNLKAIVPAINNEATNAQKDRHDQVVQQSVTQSNQTKLATENTRAQAQVQDTIQRGKDILKATNARGSWAMKVATTQSNERYAQAMDSIDERATQLSKITDPKKRAALNQKTAADLTKLQTSLPLSISQNQQLLDNAPKHGFPGWRKPDDPENAKVMQDVIDNQKKQLSDVTSRLSYWAKNGEFPVGTLSSGESSNGNDERTGTSNPSQEPITTSDSAPDDLTNPNNSIYDSAQ